MGFPIPITALFLKTLAEDEFGVSFIQIFNAATWHEIHLLQQRLHQDVGLVCRCEQLVRCADVLGVSEEFRADTMLSVLGMDVKHAYEAVGIEGVFKHKVPDNLAICGCHPCVARFDCLANECASWFGLLSDLVE